MKKKQKRIWFDPTIERANRKGVWKLRTWKQPSEKMGHEGPTISGGREKKALGSKRVLQAGAEEE